MAERYTRVYTQQGQFYCPGAPIIIEAGALLKDNQTGKIIAQLKFKNISPNSIRALTVKIAATDVTGAEVAGVDNFQYLDLNVSRDGEFGQQTPIVLPDATARSFTCQCLSAVLGDKTIWNCTENTKWVPLPKPCALASKMGTPLSEQYKRDTIPKAQYVPVEHDGLWSCACGAMNHANEQVCHSCRGSKAALFGALNIEKLQANKKKHDDAIAAEKAAVAEAEKIRAAKTKKIAVIVAVAIVLLIGVFVFTSEVIVPATKYDNAISLMDEGKYEDAQEIFLELEDYQDAAAKYTECEWRKGLDLYLSGDRYQAEQIFGRLIAGGRSYPDYVVTGLVEYLRQKATLQVEDGDYSGALYTVVNDFGSGVKNEIYELIYQKAADRMTEAKYDDALKICELLSDYKDASTLANEALYQKANRHLAEKDYDKSNPIFEQLGDYKDSKDKIHYHDYKETDAQEETCTTDGYSTLSCAGCQDEYTVTIPATGHSYANATCTKPRTCYHCGTTDGIALGHATSTGRCFRCGQDFRKTYTFTGSGLGTYITHQYVDLPYDFFTGAYTISVSGEDGAFFAIYDSKDEYIDSASWKDSIYGYERFCYISVEAWSKWTLTIKPA